MTPEQREAVADALVAHAADQLFGNNDPQWLRQMADIETGRDQPEPHQVHA